MNWLKRAVLILTVVGLSPAAWSLMDGWTTWETERVKKEIRRQDLIQESASCDIEDSSCVTYHLRNNLSQSIRQALQLPDAFSNSDNLLRILPADSHQDKTGFIFRLLMEGLQLETDSDLSLLLGQSPATRRHRLSAELKKAVDGDPSGVCVRSGLVGVSITCLTKIITIK
jgi:hypothetical protein